MDSPINNVHDTWYFLVDGESHKKQTKQLGFLLTKILLFERSDVLYLKMMRKRYKCSPYIGYMECFITVIYEQYNTLFTEWI